MTTEIVLTSPTTHLRILLETENCLFTHTLDASVLYVEAKENSFITSSHLSLLNTSREEIWSASMPCKGSQNHAKVRVDSIFPLVFGVDDIYQVFPSSILTYYEGDARNVFELRLKLDMSRQLIINYSSTIQNQISDKICSDKASNVLLLAKLADIYSEIIIVDDTAVPVSKELLVASSPFFDRLFNCNFREKDKGFYEIKEVSLVDFQWFLDSFHKRNWEFSSMDRALLALSYADRFELLYVHLRVYPYLQKRYLPKNNIKDALILCSKFKRIDQLILWVLNHCENEQNTLQLLQECAPQMNTMAVQAAFKALESIFERKKRQAVQLAVHEALETGFDKICSCVAKTNIIVLLRCFDLDGSVGHESAFGVSMDDKRNIYWHAIFSNMPTCYVVAKIRGCNRLRTEEEMSRSQFTVSGYDKVARVDAYRK